MVEVEEAREQWGGGKWLLRMRVAAKTENPLMNGAWLKRRYGEDYWGGLKYE